MYGLCLERRIETEMRANSSTCDPLAMGIYRLFLSAGFLVFAKAANALIWVE